MDAAGYTTLTRQTGLQREIQAIANNLANSATTGFRREGVIFAEYVRKLDEAPSLSMARASGRNIDLTQGELSVTGGTFDFAIQGEGFFLLETPQGNRLTRAGAFTPNGTGDLVNPDGYRLLDAGGAPVFVPAGPGRSAWQRMAPCHGRESRSHASGCGSPLIPPTCATRAARCLPPMAAKFPQKAVACCRARWRAAM